MDFHINEIDEELIQIYGEVNGWAIKTGIYGVYQYEYRYFDKEKRLIKIKGKCNSKEALIKKINNEINS